MSSRSFTSIRDKDRDRRRRTRSRSPGDKRKRDERRDRSREDRKREEKKRRRSRSGSRSKERKYRDSKRSRSRDREIRRERSKSRDKEISRGEKIIEKIIKEDLKPEKSDGSEEEVDKEEEQKRLELEMQKRRERIERWRAERKLKELENNKKENVRIQLPLSVKKWSLEDDSEDDENDKKVTAAAAVETITAPTTVITIGDSPKTEEVKQEMEKVITITSSPVVEIIDEEEIDPLDAFMENINKEVKRVNQFSNPPNSNSDNISGVNNKIANNSNQQGVMIVTGIAKKNTERNKGDLMEQNQDGLEYSSEEELEDIKDAAVNLANKHKKELAKIDHSEMNYAAFRKDFYVEIPELAKMTQDDVEKYRIELEGIQVKGKGCPKPIKNWAHCGVSKKEMDVLLKKLAFEKPTPIQCQAIPAIMSGRDLIGIAKTGSGKTLAFILPMFRHILDQPAIDDGDGPIAIIMTPTRELCMQIGKDIRRFSKYLGLRPVCVYGGTGISEQIAELKRGSEIIICTPGRMIDMLAANSGRVTNLRRVTYIVLDEADRMFDMGFEPQVMRIIDNIRPDRQTVMFSATFPRQMEALARRILKKPIEIIVGGRSVVCKEVEQNIAILDDDAKFFKLLELLGHYQEHGSIIVFVDKQENADALLKDLMKASYPCMSLHGGIDQFDRDSTIIDFKSGKVRLLIATSVAARGLDVKDLILVVNYDCPNHYEDYVHRCGRTGRAGKKGYAWTFLTTDQGRYAGEIIRALELSNVDVTPELQDLWDMYKALQEAEGKKVHTGGGFSGKGYKFDEQEANAAKESKKLQKAALGLGDSDDDEDIENDIDQQIENLFAAKRNVKETSVMQTTLPISNSTLTTSSTTTLLSSSVTLTTAGNMSPLFTVNTTSATAASADKLEMAKKLASRINAAKNLGLDSKGTTQQTAEAIFKGTPPAPPLITARTVVEQLAAKLNNKLNYQPKEDEDGLILGQPTVFNKYEEELEINDFPQQARWKVTSKEALAQISEYSEAGLTVRGTFVPQGKNPPEGERKLYLAIESCSELSVQKAKREITRLIKEELLKLSSAHHVFNKGRYKVI